LSEVKKLAGQTIWYGMSTVVSRMLSYLLTPLLTYFLVDASGMVQYGSIGLIYSYFALMNVIFTYGMETAYFRFCAQDKVNARNYFNTAFGSLLISTILFCLGLYLARVPIVNFLELDNNLNYIHLAIGILFFDTLQTIPFARLRQEQKPRKYAFIRIVGTAINVCIVFFVLAFLPQLALNNPGGFWAKISAQYDTVSMVLFANLVQSVFTFLILFPEWKIFRFKFDPAIWKQMFFYSSPMIMIGLAGIANEVIDRQLLIKFIKGTPEYAKTVQGIYSASYKLSIVVTLFITAFRLAAEPFFFNKAQDKNAPYTYAKVMKWFVITVTIAFLGTALFLTDIWSRFIGAPYRSGLVIVPILLFANIFSGIYYNLSTWYKITNKMRIGVWITLLGAVITFAGNYLFIPAYEIMASAWTTLACYASMVVLCYFLGQRYFPVPYPVKRIFTYLIVAAGLYFVQNEIVKHFAHQTEAIIRLGSGIFLLLCFLAVVLLLEKKELKSMPIIGKFIR
jgi:O-antigen/teichoic acid export membrane protein